MKLFTTLYTFCLITAQIYGGTVILPDYANDPELNMFAVECSERFNIDSTTGEGFENKEFDLQIAMTCCITLCAFEKKGILNEHGEVLKNYPLYRKTPTVEFQMKVEILKNTCEAFKCNRFIIDDE